MKAKNRKTGEVRVVDVDFEELEEATYDSVCRCCGECECEVEPDGVCPEGWPSILLAAGLI